MSTLPSWSGAKRVAIDIETNDKDLLTQGPGVRRGAYIIGVSFAIEGGPAHYLPFRHEGGDNLPAEAVLQYLKDQAAAFKGELVGANINYDLDFLAEVGINFTPRFFRDVQIAEPLLDELQFSYSLENIATRRGMNAKDEQLLRIAARCHGLDPKAEMWKLPARYIGAYAEQDARLPLLILREQEKGLREQKLGSIWDLESRVLPILLKMRRKGVRINLKKLDEAEAWLTKDETESLAKVKVLSGVQLGFEDVWDAAALEKVLGVAAPRTPKTGKPSVKKEFLAGLQGDLPRALERARKFDKARRDFIRTIREHAVGDRIHTTFNQLKMTRDDGDDAGTITGRLSSASPNLQQIQARDEELGPLCRGIFIPEDGEIWASMDFSSQEPRATIHFAVKSGCRGGLEMAERFRKDPRTDLHQATADLCGIKRKEAKTIFLGLAYSMGPAKLCERLGLPIAEGYSKRLRRKIPVAGPEGQVILDKFHAMVPFLKELSEKVQAAGARRGYIRTLLGRRCRFPIDSEKSDERHTEFQHLSKALNKLVQSSSADQTKAAMLAVDQAGFSIGLQVHDELCLSVPSKAEAEQVARIMENAVPLEVPTVVDVEVGPSWGEAKS
jgi:DNA polymerase I-like protein with 3'-5' exonuclease and polymerase domains